MARHSPKVLGFIGLHPNTALVFNSKGLKIEVSINITIRMKTYMSPNNIYKGDKMYIYKLSKQLNRYNICSESVTSWQDELLRRCMVSCRKAKIEMLENEINNLN